MKTDFLLKVAELSGTDVNELSSLSHSRLVNEVILPVILNPGGQDIRGWRIGDDYMMLLAEFGEYCLQQDYFTGEIMLEIALQRLSCGAVLHESSRYDILPKEYYKYSAAWDQYGLMSDACWKFLTKQYKTCLRTNLAKEHVTKIIFGLIDHLDEDGNELDRYMLNYDHFHTSSKEVFDWAWKTAAKEFSFEKRYTHFATPERWRKYKTFFKENWKEINQKDFFSKIGESGFFNKRKIRKEILG